MMVQVFIALLFLQAVLLTLPDCHEYEFGYDSEVHDWCICRLENDPPTCCDEFGFGNKKCLKMDYLYPFHDQTL